MEFWITDSLYSPSVITTWKWASNAEYKTLQDATQECDKGRSNIFRENRWSYLEWVDEKGSLKGSGLVTWQGLAGVAFIVKMPSEQDLKGKENIICSFDSFYSCSRSSSWARSMQKMNAYWWHTLLVAYPVTVLFFPLWQKPGFEHAAKVPASENDSWLV